MSASYASSIGDAWKVQSNIFAGNFLIFCRKFLSSLSKLCAEKFEIFDRVTSIDRLGSKRAQHHATSSNNVEAPVERSGVIVKCSVQ